MAGRRRLPVERMLTVRTVLLFLAISAVAAFGLAVVVLVATAPTNPSFHQPPPYPPHTIEPPRG